MDERTRYRLNDIIDAIEQIEFLVEGLAFPGFVQDRVKRAAFERFLEIISEESRHLPDEYKHEHPEVPWRKIADVGNHLRHAYHRIDAEILWEIHRSGELAELRSAIEQMSSKLL
jgi:uncharacterized protein with HEPN domain